MNLLDRYKQKLQEVTTKPKSLLDRVKEKLQNVTCDPEKFYEIFEQYHRVHQKAAIHSATKYDNGQIIIPTGTGKTRIQIHIHVEDMIKKNQNDQTGVYVIGAHRLLLCAQLMDDLQDLCIKCGVPINVLYVGSARHDDKNVYEKYFRNGITRDTFESSYTTTMEDIETFAKKTKEQKRHLIIVSTYHSFDRLKILNEIDVCTYDEAHTTVAEDFSENIFESVKPKIKRNYFFTATRRVRGKQFGMNDTERYGKILCSIPPREMIEAGEILMPRLHIMNLKNYSKGLVKDNNTSMLVQTVVEGFAAHKDKLKSESSNPDAIGAKLLVSCKGSDELKVIQDSPKFKGWCESNNVKVFSFSSRHGNFEDFEEEQNRTKVYESLRNLRDEEDAIFLHIDILTEGIDLPSITAVMLLRHLNTAKLMQTLGRALRLLKSDRIKLYRGELTPDDRTRYTKPYAYVMLPMHFQELNASAIEMKVMLRTIITEYGLPTEEFLPRDNGTAKSKDPDLPEGTPKKPGDENRQQEEEYPLLHLIEDFILNKFGEGLPKNKLERYQTITEILKDSNVDDQVADVLESLILDDLTEGEDTDA